MLSKSLVSYELTFLASIRTTAIFAGLSIILWNKKFYKFTAIILFLCIVIHLLGTYTFYSKTYKEMKEFNIIVVAPVIQSILLMVVLSLLLVGVIKEIINKK